MTLLSVISTLFLLQLPSFIDAMSLKPVTRLTSSSRPLTPDAPIVNFHVLKSSALNGLPWLEIHHIVLLGSPDSNTVFALDYSPFDQSIGDTVQRLLMGRNVPAEIRMRMLDAPFQDLQAIKQKWQCLGWPDSESCDITDLTNSRIVDMNDINIMQDIDANVRNVIDRIYRKWSCSMNLYTHNCQHFSYFVADVIQKDMMCILGEDDRYVCSYPPFLGVVRSTA